MGWTGHKLEDGYILYTRGGTNGVFISHKDRVGLEIKIPEEVLIMLAASTIRNHKISELEQMEDKQVLGIGGKQ